MLQLRTAAVSSAGAAMIDLDGLKVPKALRLAADEIVAITDAVCRAVLDEALSHIRW